MACQRPVCMRSDLFARDRFGRSWQCPRSCAKPISPRRRLRGRCPTQSPQYQLRVQNRTQVADRRTTASALKADPRWKAVRLIACDLRLIDLAMTKTRGNGFELNEDELQAVLDAPPASDLRRGNAQGRHSDRRPEREGVMKPLTRRSFATTLQGLGSQLTCPTMVLLRFFMSLRT